MLFLASNSRVLDLMDENFSEILKLCLQCDGIVFGVPDGSDNRDDTLLQAAFQTKIVDELAQAIAIIGGKSLND